MAPCKTCISKCCRYFALELDTPKTLDDFENGRWFLAHKGISVFVDKRKWHMEVRNKCKYLAKDNTCNVYDKRPKICKEHSNHECENVLEDFEHDYIFHDMEEFDEYLKNRKKRKK